METTETNVTLAQFAPVDSKKIETLSMQLSSIKTITTEAERSNAEIVMKNAKSFYKELKAQRMSFTAKLDTMKQNAMSYEKTLDNALAPTEAAVNAYVQRCERDRQAAQAKIDEDNRKKIEAEQKKAAQAQAVIDFEIRTLKAISECKTKKQIEDAHEKLLTYKPTIEIFGDNLDEAISKRKGMLKISQAAKEAIANKKTLEIDIVAVEAKKDEAAIVSAEKIQNIDLQAQASSQSLGTTANVKRLWTFEVTNIERVPSEFLTVDSVKVNAMIKAGRRDINGLRIFQEVSRSGR